ncbi:MAG: mechanosensitive ion channel [Desulfuromonadaceae bacterium]|nr:mechanosensitive ion channel [Desulfuromonadaceae bacterium]
MNFGKLWIDAQEWLAFYGLKIIAAILIFIIGRWVSRAVKNFLQRLMTRKGVDGTLISFVGSMTYFALMTFVIIAALNQIGIQTTSLIAVIGAAGLAIGLALQGSLANFAAGVLLIIFRPFKAGDYIEGAGVAGSVEEIEIFTTKMKTPDNRVIIVPNAKLSGDNITNYSAKPQRRLDLIIGVGYHDDLRKVKEVLKQLVDEDPRILRDPEPLVAVLELADSSVNLVVRPWVATGNYWDVHFDLTQKIKERFDLEGITIPFPQRDIHIYTAHSETKGETLQ